MKEVTKTFLSGKLSATLIIPIETGQYIANRKENVKFLAAVYVVYILAAIAVGYTESHWSMWVVLIPISALIFVMVNALYHRRH
ncbi:MAG: hypothetical protein DLM72_03325 [Candidatus Nitrosopolaris wilkensis]|nr:MAG: hypothetical protein DLM72_03325 [Candidatus Nitrosopolaris wilkensis]